MTTNEFWTLSIAGYAAIISTFVLGWDVYKWLDSGPKVRLTASTGMKMVGGGQIDPKTYVSVTAVNLGDRATTITNLGLLYYDSWISLRRNKAKKAFIVATPSQAQPISYRFEAGAQWIGICDQDDEVATMIRDGYLFVVLYHSHYGKGVRHRLKVQQLKA
ncbi:hypothetical protein [Burkholderia pseudomallei]|uniref:hypothetical protein n=1 Tax=Burkholderia pseudomallei TaxID=28450 RepID=UPI0009786FD9|nr:hypothetical protein [Burkholderia pseudomallei]